MGHYIFSILELVHHIKQVILELILKGNNTTTATKRDAQAEYPGLIKTALRNTVQNVNFADPFQTRRAHETLMHDVKRKVRYIDTKYSMQIDPLYFESDKFIPTLENHFLDIVEQLLRHDYLRYASVHNQGQSIPASSSELSTKT